MLWPVLAVALAAADATPSPAPPDSELAAAARREAQRRQRTPRSPHTYVDADLRPPGEKGAAADATAAEPPAVSYAPPPASERRNPDDVPPKEFRDQEGRDIRETTPLVPEADAGESGRPERGSWADAGVQARGQLAAAEAELARNTSKQDELRARLNPMSSTYTIDTNEQLQIQSDLTDLQTEAKGLQQAVDGAQADLAKLQERARRAGVPQRWLESDRQ
jgi:hypothetical protein